MQSRRLSWVLWGRLYSLFNKDVIDLMQAIQCQLTQRLGKAVLLAGLGLMAAVIPAHSAEDIIISYGILERKIPIRDLEAFANGEDLSPQLAAYASYAGLTDEELSAGQRVLTQKVDISQVDVAQFLYTSQGTTLLTLVGDVVQTPSRQSGFSAIRGAMILAAADETAGLSILNFLKKYPTPAIRINVGRGLEIARDVTETLDNAERAYTLVNALANEAAQQSPGANTLATRQLIFDLPDFAVAEQALFLPDRDVAASFFWPRPRLPNQALPENIPVVVVSHGLGDERSSYRYLAAFLAQRGFAVAVLDHPGSNSRQIAQLLSGFTPELINDREFENRPQDISTLLDEIQLLAERRADLRDRLDINNVGVIGQSFGGYTALALAGATYSPNQLTAACSPQPDYLNPSLLLQCQAATVAAETPVLRDDRVQAVLTVNPVGSEIFGPAGFGAIEIPTLILAATADTVAPALPEQIEPFTWLQTEHRYLVLTSSATHFSVIDWNAESAPSVPVPVALLGSNPELAQDYLQILALAFMQRHLRQDERYDAALTAEFLQNSVARSPLAPLSLIENLRPEALEQAINGEEVLSDRGVPLLR
ncbi:MAG: alpha/beta fold hydrolase [Cyanobacteria bacterium P01_C01_bin.120]